MPKLRKWALRRAGWAFQETMEFEIRYHNIFYTEMGRRHPFSSNKPVLDQLSCVLFECLYFGYQRQIKKIPMNGISQYCDGLIAVCHPMYVRVGTQGGVERDFGYRRSRMVWEDPPTITTLTGIGQLHRTTFWTPHQKIPSLSLFNREGRTVALLAALE